MRGRGNPVNQWTVSIWDHPLIRNPRGERPEETELEILAGIKRFEGVIDEKALPVGVRLTQLRNEFGGGASGQAG